MMKGTRGSQGRDGKVMCVDFRGSDGSCMLVSPQRNDGMSKNAQHGEQQ